MKKLFAILLVAFTLSSCTKENDQELTGEWTLVAIHSGDGYRISTSTYDPRSVANVRFFSDGRIKVSGQLMTYLSQYDRYVITGDQQMVLVNSTDNQKAEVSYSFGDGLELWFLNARCGYGEQFVRTY